MKGQIVDNKAGECHVCSEAAQELECWIARFTMLLNSSGSQDELLQGLKEIELLHKQALQGRISRVHSFAYNSLTLVFVAKVAKPVPEIYIADIVAHHPLAMCAHEAEYAREVISLTVKAFADRPVESQAFARLLLERIGGYYSYKSQHEGTHTLLINAAKSN